MLLFLPLPQHAHRHYLLKKLKRRKTTAIAKATETMAPSLIIPGVKKHLTKSYLLLMGKKWIKYKNIKISN